MISSSFQPFTYKSLAEHTVIRYAKKQETLLLETMVLHFFFEAYGQIYVHLESMHS